MRFLRISAALLLLFTGMAFGQEVRLVHRFTAGERAEMTLVAEVTGTLSGQPIHYHFNLALGLSTERLLPEGAAEVAVELKSLSMRGEAQGRSVNQDWDAERIATLGLPGAPLRMVVTPDGKISQVTGEEQLGQKISEWLDFRKYLVEGELLFPALPERAVRVGEAWSLVGEVGIPFARGRAPATIERSLVDVRPVDGSRRALLRSVSRVELTAPPAPDPEVTSGVQLARCRQETETQLVFDVDAGRVLETRQSGDFSATLVPVQPEGLKLPPSETEARMEVRIETTTRYE